MMHPPLKKKELSSLMNLKWVFSLFIFQLTPCFNHLGLSKTYCTQPCFPEQSEPHSSSSYDSVKTRLSLRRGRGSPRMALPVADLTHDPRVSSVWGSAASSHWQNDPAANTLTASAAVFIAFNAFLQLGDPKFTLKRRLGSWALFCT